MSKKILLINRHAPYGTSIAREALDAALAASVYDQDLSLLFMDDGVFQLINHQDAQRISQKNFAAMLPVLPLYGIEKIFVHQESLNERSITPDELAIKEIILINNKEIGTLMTEQDQLLSF